MGSPHLLPHSPVRSARSVTPVVGSYFGTGHNQQLEENRRGSYFSIFSAGQPATPQSTRTRDLGNDEDMVFWGRHSPRSHDADMEDADQLDEELSSSDDEIMTDEEDEEEVEDGLNLPGHR